MHTLSRPAGRLAAAGVAGMLAMAVAACGAQQPAKNEPSTATGSPNSAPSAQVQTVQFALNWIPISEHVGAFVALEKGYWKDLGLNVQVSRGYGSTDSLKRVAVGTVDVSLSDATSLIQAKAKDPSIPVKTLAIHYQNAPYVVVYVKGRKINEPKDLAKAVHAGVPGGSDTQFYPAFLKAVGLPPKPAGFVAVDAAAKVPTLLQGQVDAFAAFMSSVNSVKDAAEKANLQIGYWRMADYGIDPYSLGVIASDKTIKERPAMLQSFVKGWLQGWAWTSAHPEEAVAMFKKHNPEASEQGTLADLKNILPLIVPAATAEKGIGYMSRERWQTTADLTKSYMELETLPPLDSLYTEAFFTKVTPEKSW